MDPLVQIVSLLVVGVITLAYFALMALPFVLFFWVLRAVFQAEDEEDEEDD